MWIIVTIKLYQMKNCLILMVYGLNFNSVIIIIIIIIIIINNNNNKIV